MQVTTLAYYRARDQIAILSIVTNWTLVSKITGKISYIFETRKSNLTSTLWLGRYRRNFPLKMYYIIWSVKRRNDILLLVQGLRLCINVMLYIFLFSQTSDFKFASLSYSSWRITVTTKHFTLLKSWQNKTEIRRKVIRTNQSRHETRLPCEFNLASVIQVFTRAVTN